MSEKKYEIDFERWSGGEEDVVGEAMGFIYKGRWYAMLLTKAGMYRGSHIHNINQRTMLLNGKGKYVFKVDGKNVEHPLCVGEPLFVPKGTPHVLLPEEDCLTAEWWEGEFHEEAYDFPEYMDGIRAKIKKVMDDEN
jgi:hypothetical protein